MICWAGMQDQYQMQCKDGCINDCPPKSGIRQYKLKERKIDIVVFRDKAVFEPIEISSKKMKVTKIQDTVAEQQIDINDDIREVKESRLEEEVQMQIELELDDDEYKIHQSQNNIQHFIEVESVDTSPKCNSQLSLPHSNNNYPNICDIIVSQHESNCDFGEDPLIQEQDKLEQSDEKQKHDQELKQVHSKVIDFSSREMIIIEDSMQLDNQEIGSNIPIQTQKNDSTVENTNDLSENNCVKVLEVQPLQTMKSPDNVQSVLLTTPVNEDQEYSNKFINFQNTKCEPQINTLPSTLFKGACWTNRTGQKKKAAIYPAKRWGHSAVMHNKYMYVYGGCGRQTDSSKTIQIFRLDCEIYEWDKIVYQSEVIPAARDSHSASIIRDQMWVFGGSNCKLLYNDFWRFCFSSHKWIEETSNIKGQIPSPREGHVVAVLGERYLIIIGGFNQETNTIFQDIFLVDTLLMTCKQIGNMPEPIRESQSASLIGDSIYVFGGQGKNEEFFGDLFKVDIVDIEGNAHTIVQLVKPSASSLIPGKRSSHQQISFQNRYIIIIGGEGSKEEESKVKEFNGNEGKEVINNNDKEEIQQRDKSEDEFQNAEKQISNEKEELEQIKDKSQISEVETSTPLKELQSSLLVTQALNNNEETNNHDHLNANIQQMVTTRNGRSRQNNAPKKENQSFDQQQKSTVPLLVQEGELLQQEAGQKNEEKEVKEVLNQSSKSKRPKKDVESSCNVFSDSWVFDTRINKWFELDVKTFKSGFRGRFSFSTILFKSKIIAFGGMQGKDHLFEDVMVLNLKEEQLQQLTQNNEVMFLNSNMKKTQNIFMTQKNSQINQLLFITTSTKFNHYLMHQQQFVSFSRLQELRQQNLQQIIFQNSSLSIKDFNEDKDSNGTNIGQHSNTNDTEKVNENGTQQNSQKENQQKPQFIFNVFMKIVDRLLSFGNKQNVQILCATSNKIEFSIIGKAITELEFKLLHKIISTPQCIINNNNNNNNNNNKRNHENLNKEQLHDSPLQQQLIIDIGLSIAEFIQISKGQAEISSTNGNIQIKGIFNLISNNWTKYVDIGQAQTENAQNNDEQCKESIVITFKGTEQIIQFNQSLNDITLVLDDELKALQIPALKNNKSQPITPKNNRNTNSKKRKKVQQSKETQIFEDIEQLLSKQIDFSFKTYASYFYSSPPEYTVNFNNSPIQFKSYLVYLSQFKWLAPLSYPALQRLQVQDQFSHYTLFSKQKDFTNDTQGCFIYSQNKLSERFDSQAPMGLAEIKRVLSLMKQQKQVYKISGVAISQSIHSEEEISKKKSKVTRQASSPQRGSPINKDLKESPRKIAKTTNYQ